MKAFRSLLVGMLAGLAAGAARAETIEFAASASAPFYDEDAAGKVSGTFLPRLDEIFAAAGLSAHYAVYPLERLRDELEDGRVQVSAYAKTDISRQFLLFTDTPLLTVHVSIFWTKGAAPVKGLADLAGRNVLTLIGHQTLQAALGAAAPGVVPIPVRDHALAAGMLAHHRAEYLLDYTEPAKQEIARIPGLEVESRTLESSPIYLAVSKRAPGAAGLLARLDAAMKATTGRHS